MRADAPIATVDQYLASLPEERALALTRVRDTIRANLPAGYVEAMTWRMPTYEVPLERYPDTYNGKPLMYAAFASQKRHMAVYLSGLYVRPEAAEQFVERYRQETGRTPDMGKSCVRYSRIEQLPLGLIGETIAATSVDELVTSAEAVRRRR